MERLALGTVQQLLARADSIAAEAARDGARLDREKRFPSAAMAALGEAGLLGSVVPSNYGGADLSGGIMLLALLHSLGRGSMAVGRIFEAHVNALRLVMRYGNEPQRRQAAKDAISGKLFALWVTDDPASPLRSEHRSGILHLSGTKSICSAAGHAQRAVVTAATPEGTDVMLLLSLGAGEQVCAQNSSLLGMRAAVSGRVSFDGCTAPTTDMIGRPGDYLREPEFSTGAWRSSAVALGGLAAILFVAREQLVARGRDGDPHQRARMAQTFIAHQTGWLWLQKVAQLLEHEGDAVESVAYVNLARTAIERMAMDALQAVQRSLGLTAFLEGSPVERLCRDLATYLRQPAPDEALDEAAAYFMRHELPGGQQ